MDKALTTKQVAETLNVNQIYVIKLCTRGLLKGFKLDAAKKHSEWRIWPRELRLYISRQTKASRPKKKSLVDIIDEHEVKDVKELS